MKARLAYWPSAPPATEDAIENLVASYPDLPAVYLSLLRASNGGEGPLPCDPYCLVLSSAEEALSENSSEPLAQLHDLFAIGSNGAGEFLAIALTAEAAVYAIPWIGDCERDRKLVASTLVEFAGLMGRDEED